MIGVAGEDPESLDMHVLAGVQATGDDWESILDPEYVRAIPNTPPDPAPLKVPKSLTAFQGKAWDGLFGVVEDLFYVTDDIAGTDPGLEAALSRPMTALLAAFQQEDDSDDPEGDLIAAVRRVIDAVTGYQQSTPAPPELIDAVAGLAKELRADLSKTHEP